MAAIDLCESREWQRKPIRSDVGGRRSRTKACALATGVFRGSAATWAWRRAGRAARNAKAAAELPSAVPAEPLSAARGGGAKRSRASNRRCVALVWLPKGGGRKSTTSERYVLGVLHPTLVGRRPKAIPPGFGETYLSGTRFFNIDANRYLLAPSFRLTQSLLRAGPDLVSSLSGPH